ncbi:hypothetical protein [Paenibacillus arenilitoris]|uniref:Uncharacterized protein n=1 Tax=Paenibacillus arenilitoris TaxID=2772299 RepID=A0A927CM51_9BACL|nr:hypothetical protein [Paenibacillus arenilitoris]MBD2869955.1 hypothetical protein [Paenibacillus arenilitoris]
MKKYAAIAVIALASLTAFTFASAGVKEYIPVKATPDLQSVYIDQVESKDGRYVVTFDRMEWYEGEQAAQKFKEREEDAEMDGPPDGYYIVNDDVELRELPIAEDAVVLMQIYNRTGKIEEADIVWDEQITVGKFAGLIETEDDLALKNFPYHLTVKNGEIVRIVQQYVP